MSRSLGLCLGNQHSPPPDSYSHARPQDPEGEGPVAVSRVTSTGKGLRRVLLAEPLTAFPSLGVLDDMSHHPNPAWLEGGHAAHLEGHLVEKV